MIQQNGNFTGWQFGNGSAVLGNSIQLPAHTRAFRVLPCALLVPTQANPSGRTTIIVVNGSYPCRWSYPGLGTFQLNGPIWMPVPDEERGGVLSFIDCPFSQQLINDATALGGSGDVGVTYCVEWTDDDDDVWRSMYTGALPKPNVPTGSAINTALDGAHPAQVPGLLGVPISVWADGYTMTIQNRAAGAVSVFAFLASLATLLVNPTDAAVKAKGQEIVAGGSETITVPRGNILWISSVGAQGSPGDTRLTMVPLP